MSTGPGPYSLTIYRGDTYSWRFVLWQDDAHTVAVDLTGWTARAQVRCAPGGPVMADLDVAIELPQTVTLHLDAATSAGLANGRWDLQLDDGGGNVRTVLAGRVDVGPDVTVAAV